MSNVTRICVEKVLPHHRSHYAAISGNEELRAAFYENKVWPSKSEIKIGFLDSPTSANKRTDIATLKSVGQHIDPLQETLKDTPIKDAVRTIVKQRIQPLVGLEFSFVPDEEAKTADVRISFKDPDGAWSLVGTDAQHPSQDGKATMNLGWFDVGTVIHEFGHVLGMIHEHQNPKGLQIDWNVPAVNSYMSRTQGWDPQEVKTNVLNRYKADQINGSAFDPLSVMLYFFPGSLTLNNEGTRQNFSLSGEDAVWISKTYPGGSLSPSKFYHKAYDRSLESSLQESKADLAEMSGKTPHTIALVVFVILLLAGIGVLIWWLLKKK